MLYSYELFFFTLLSLQVYIFSLRLVEVRIPNYVIKGSSAQLECLYDLDGEALYSVKWYKDGNEFYRYVPRDMPPAQTFLLPGVSVDVHNSSDAIVTLREVTLQSAGRFRCEVSGEAPSFQTVTEHGDMIVVSLPDQGPPKITGGRPRYQIGDWVRINCTAGRSKPAVQLSWFINGEAAAPHTLKKYDVIISGREGLETSVLGLQFRVEQHHFRNGDMKLKCVASLSTLYWRSNEESVEGDRPQKAPVLESRETVYASNSRADPVQGMSLRESFLTKILSFFIQPNAASSKTDSMLLNKNSTNLQIILIALVILAILNGNIKHIYLATIILRKGSIQKSNISHSKSNNNNNNNINNNNNNKDSNEFDMSCSRRKVIKEIALIKIQVKQQHLTLEQSLAMTRYGKQFQEFQQQEEQHKQSLYEICGKNEVKLNEFNLVEEMLENRQLFKNFHSLMMPLFLFPFLILLTYNIKQKQWQWQQYKHHLHHQKHQQKQQQQMPTTVHTISVSVVKKFTNIATTYYISTNNNTNSNISKNNRSSSNKSNNNDTNSHSIICNSTNSSSCNSFSSSNKYHNNAQQLQQQQEKEQQLRHQQQKRQPYQINYR